MTMITPSYLGETIEYSSLHACRSTLEDPTSDDGLRSDLISEAGEPTLRELLESVAPHFESINGYLDSLEDDLPEAAMALQALAECAAEARMAIKDRGDRN